jgi:shikimate dehydrogenase
MQGTTKTYCIIGDPIHHSLSPAMHNAAFNHLGLDCTYIAYRVPYLELEESVASLRAINIAGFNVTLPHKVSILKHLDVLELGAQKVGAVNTVNNVYGVLHGYNTDTFGFIQPLMKRHVRLSGMTVLLMGAGGSARAVVAALSEHNGVSKILIVNRTLEKADELVKLGIGFGVKCESHILSDVQGLAQRSDLIVNTIPPTMEHKNSFIDSEHIPKGSIVYDIVYKPVLTRLLENATRAGAQTVYGYEMLLEQGGMSFRIWTGIKPPIEAMKKALFGVFGERS